MYRRKTYRRKTQKRTYKRKSYARKTLKREPIKKIVRREIARNIENKTSQYYDGGGGLYTIPSAAFSAANIHPLGPTSAFGPIINQGTGQGARVGNRIKTKKLVVKGTLTPFSQNASTNTNPKPVQVKMWILYDKLDPTAEPDPKIAGDFFQLGGSSKSFANDLTDLWAPVNTDRYRILTTRTFKLGYSVYTANTAAGNSNQYANNDYPLSHNFSIDCTKYYPMDVRFNDNNSVPTTRGLFMMFAYVAADGQALAADQLMVKLQYMQDYQYEDA